MKVLFRLLAAAGAAWSLRGAESAVTPENPASLQHAIDASPGRMVYVPAGDYPIAATLQLRSDNSGLWGPGRIIQTDPGADIVNAEGRRNIQLRDVVLTRPEGRRETHRPGVRLIRCADVTLDNVQILDNQGDLASVFAAYCSGLQIRNCLIQNYSRIAIDDRTTITYYGFAFYCINGTGILIRHSTGTLIAHNRIVELLMVPTRELQQKYQLGKYARKNPRMGTKMSREAWDSEYFNGWHQGAAIQITKGETTDYAQILGNYVENAAQGIDIHGDHVVMANNIVNNAFIGMKAIHGSRNVIIIGNQFTRNDLWSIQLKPGTASHAAFSVAEASAPDPADPEALTWTINRPGANVDGYSIVANNIISDFGYGTAHWMWEAKNTAPIQFTSSPSPERSPPETDVIISGNVLYDTGRDQVMVDGRPRLEPPRYRYAVQIGEGAEAPRGLHFTNNLLHPGTDGISNLPLTP